MAQKPHTNRTPGKPGGSRYAALAFLAVIILAIGAYLLDRPGRPVPATSPTAAPQGPAYRSPAVPSPSVPHNYSAAAKIRPVPQRYPEPATAPDEAPSVNRPAGQPGRLAIIIDDMGSSMQEARALAGIGVPLTFSIIPGLHSYRDVAAFASSSGIETMIHIPMQSKGWPERRLESNGLLVSMSDGEINDRLEEYLRAIPKAVGANNHMGSEFSEHEDKMRVVLGGLKGRGLFFIDSVTSPQTVATRLARELDMRSGRRNVFLDNEQDTSYILGQLDQAVRMAKKRGAAIAICHPHPATIRTLQAALPRLAAQGVTLVPASQLVR